MVLLILWLCVGGAAAGTEVAANSPAVVGGAVQTGLTAACALYAASRTICSGTKATVTVPRVVVGEDDWSGTPMEGDDLVASLPHYRAVLHSTKRISVTLPDGKELTKMAVASSRQRLRAKLQELSSVCDLQLHEDIARAQVQLHVLTRHNASFGACTNGGRRQKLQTKRSRKQQLMSARLKKKPCCVVDQSPTSPIGSVSDSSVLTTPSRPVTRQHDMSDKWLDGASCSDSEPSTNQRPKRQCCHSPQYSDTRPYAGKNSKWEHLSRAGKKHRIGSLVTELVQQAASEDGLDEMVSHLLSNPRLSRCNANRTRRELRSMKVQGGLFDRVVEQLKELRKANVTNSANGYKVRSPC